MANVRPVLRWAGSKRQLLSKLHDFWGDHFERYVEPFAGSCSLYFRIGPKAALLCDKNSDLIQFYEVLRSQPVDVHRAASALAPTEEQYRRVRSIHPDTLPALQRAARFVYLNRNCFNGIYRTNQKGEFNVPFAKSKQGSLPSLSEFIAAAELLKSAEVRAWDFGTTLRYCREGDFVYLDPPYFVAEHRVFREYGPREFGLSDLTRLRDHLNRLDSRGVKFLLSYADTPDAEPLMAEWQVHRVEVRRNVAGFIGHRRKSTEVLITNIE